MLAAFGPFSAIFYLLHFFHKFNPAYIKFFYFHWPGNVSVWQPITQCPCWSYQTQLHSLPRVVSSDSLQRGSSAFLKACSMPLYQKYFSPIALYDVIDSQACSKQLYLFSNCIMTKTGVGRCYRKQLFLNILQYSQENTCLVVSF